jgi:hypothetical protein
MTAQIAVGHYLEIAYGEGAETISLVYGPAQRAVGPGMTIWQGRVFILPYGGIDREFYQGLLNPIRRAVLQETLARSANPQPAVVASYSPHVSVYTFETAASRTAVLVNASSDDAADVRLAGGMFADAAAAKAWVVYGRTEPNGRKVELKPQQDGLALPGTLPALSVVLLHQTREGE